MATLTLNTHDLHRALKTAAVFATTDATIPGLRGVKINVLPTGEILFSATDRFRIGIVRITATEHAGIDPAGQPFYLSLDDVKTLVPLLKVPARDQGKHTTDVTLDARELTWDTGTTRGAFRHYDHETPKLFSLIDTEATTPIVAEDAKANASRLGVNPAYLASFAKAAWERRDTMIVEPATTPARPCMIRVGDHFLGLIMPVRTNGSAADSVETREAWRDLVNALRDAAAPIGVAA